MPILERKGELKLRGETRRQLIEISAATSDRLLAAEKKKYQLKGRLGTKPGALLKYQILIKRFAERQEDRPWFVKVILVAHVG